MTKKGHWYDIHSPVIPARNAEIQPYFHFYAKSKIRGFLCLSKGVIPALDAGI
ncbi:hypothetical protein [Wolbachia endosymbiont of Ctenocephalides felis wCfeJ]|uniref:hypothetical protein n=1 Tax=Wolbachia endosymbiont of Ctenocephalides felis wCfeJ TaxID=2732594 RepID=UPI001445706C|nr:hypothetical protein [Wolbachia endosymbiont of Ctenocephalides felis wCfeJ]WCR57786.1 MAG: hypothetical protein PG980_000258 [Wolbachia endosymbiont of Ctenocephalides felis wCfeJ]